MGAVGKLASAQPDMAAPEGLDLMAFLQARASPSQFTSARELRRLRVSVERAHGTATRERQSLRRGVQ